MLEALGRYPYLAGSLGLLAAFALAYWRLEDQRGPMLLSGVLSTPFSFASIMFVPEYWHPVRLVEFGTGVEDLLFSFATGGLVWALAVWPFRRRLAVALDARRIAAGYMLISTAGMAATTFSWKHGFSPMGATLLSVLALGAGLCLLRARHLPILATGTLTFAALYWAWFFCLTVLCPQWLAHWNHGNLWGIQLPRGVPLEEMAWAVGFGGVWPLFMAFLFGARWRGAQGGRPARLDAPMTASS